MSSVESDAVSGTAVGVHLQKFWISFAESSIMMTMERHFVRPGSVKLALEWRLGQPCGAKLALERRFGLPGGVKLALELFGRPDSVKLVLKQRWNRPWLRP